LLEKTDHPNELLLHDLAAQAMEHIENVVCESLNENKELKPLDYLECIKEACEDESFSRVDIFTLNHDTVLEKYLGRYLNKIKIVLIYDFLNQREKKIGIGIQGYLIANFSKFVFLNCMGLSTGI